MDREPIRILILAANPSGTAGLRLVQEARRIKAALENRTKITFDLRRCEAVRSEDLRFEVLSYKPHFVHFSGHGAGETGLLLEDDSGATQFVTSEALSSFFEIFKTNVKCVFLNCCYSQPQAEAIASHIPFVIGTRESISDKAAIEFSVAFYEAIGQQEQIPTAFQYGIAALKLKNLFHESRIPFLVPISQVHKPDPRESPQPDIQSCLTLLRPQEESILRSWILEEHCRFVLLRCPDSTTNLMRGDSPVGEDALRSPDLVTRIAGELRLQDSFECTLSESLDSAPPITQTLSRLLSALSGARDIRATPLPQEQIRLLIQQLRKRRCLILLEGLDAIFAEGGSGYLPGYAEYADLFEQISETRHQSCVMVTSRRDIRDIARQSAIEQIRFIKLLPIKEPNETYPSSTAPSENLNEPFGKPNFSFRYQNRPSLYARIKACSRSALLRASERLPVHQLSGTAGEARLAPVSRSETAPSIFDFLMGPRPLLGIIGESGTGKTLLSHQIGTELPLVLYYDSHCLDAAGSLTEALERDLGVRGNDLEHMLLHIDSLLYPTEKFVILVDAINEAVRIDPIVLKAEIESISTLFPKTSKLIYTCRKVYWESHIQAQSPLPRELYHDSSVFVLGDFSDSEAQEAFERYKKFFCFSGSYENLNDDLKRKVANPLMLRMLAEGYQGTELPSFAPAVQIFQRYYHTLQERLSETILLDFLTLLVRRKALFLSLWEPESDQFQSLIVRTDPELATLSQQQLAGRVRPGDPLLLLEDEGILTAVDHAKRHYRFTYDRFYEYLLGMDLGYKISFSSPALFSESLVGMLINLRARHFSYTQALKSEIVRQTLLSTSPIWSFTHQDTLTSLLCSPDSHLVLFTKEVLRELLFESSSDIIGSLKATFIKESSWLPIALDIIGDSHSYLLPLAVKGLFSGEASIARRSVLALIPLLGNRSTRQRMEDLLIEHLASDSKVSEAEAAGLLYYSAALVAQSEDTGADCLQEISHFFHTVLSLDKLKDQIGLEILKGQFYRLVKEEGPNFFPSETNHGFDYLWSEMPSDIQQQATVLPKLLRVTQISEHERQVLRFFGSEIRDWSLRDTPWISSIFTYRIEYRLSQWALIYHSSQDYKSVRDILESFATSKYWLTVDFALCTMQFILLYVHAGDLTIVRDGFAQMQRWVQVLEETEQFFDTFNREDPFKASYNPLAQTATVDAHFFSRGNQRISFLDGWIGATETRRCALGLLAARQLWQCFPHQTLASLRPAAMRSEEDIVDLLDRTLREMYYVYPRLVERAFAQWGMPSRRAQSIRFRTDVPDPTGVEFRAEPLYRELFLTTAERRLRTADWYEQLFRQPTLRDFCYSLFDYLLRETIPQKA